MEGEHLIKPPGNKHKKKKMGSSSSTPPKLTSNCPICSSPLPQEMETTILTWLNHYFGEFVKRKRKLSMWKNCPLGEITDIKLCTLLTFPILDCIEVKIDSIRGLEDLKFVQFKIFREQDTLHVILGVTFGIPQANLSLTRLRTCKSTSKVLTYPLPKSCNNTEIALGSEKNHAAIHMEIVIPEFASPKVAVQTVLGDVKMECLEGSKLLEFIRPKLVEALRIKVNDILTVQMQNFLTNAWKNLTG
jgi:hypothetical protein